MKRRVLVVRASLQPPGGGRAVAAWMIEALRGVHQVGVLSWEPVGLAAINRHYGTSLQSSDVTLHSVSAVLARNLTLANSDWTARRVAALHGITATTLYPPVSADFPVVPWDERENGFVCLGRIVPAKRVEVIVAILAEVRRRGHDVHLHIIGGPGDRQYYDRVRGLQAEP